MSAESIWRLAALFWLLYIIGLGFRERRHSWASWWPCWLWLVVLVHAWPLAFAGSKAGLGAIAAWFLCLIPCWILAVPSLFAMFDSIPEAWLDRVSRTINSEE